jgi:polyhydroxybutyrate depolymerase
MMLHADRSLPLPRAILGLLFLGCFQISCLQTEGQIQDKTGSPTPDAEQEEMPAKIEIPNGENLFEHDGLPRTFRIYLPEHLPEGAPLLFVFHGYTGSAETIESYSGMNAVADANGFAVCYPQGTLDAYDNAFFNVGYSFHEGVNIDDLGFVRQLSAHLQYHLALSDTHVFSTGMSNGGDISYLLACQASDIFKAIAPVSGIMLESIKETCAPLGPMPVFEIHGTEDDVSFFDGDLEDSEGWGAYDSIPNTIDYWVTHNDLNRSEESPLPDTNTSDDSQVVFERYWSNASEAEVWLYRIEGGGHDWPGVWGNEDIAASEAVWQFLSQYIDD